MDNFNPFEGLIENEDEGQENDIQSIDILPILNRNVQENQMGFGDIDEQQKRDHDGKAYIHNLLIEEVRPLVQVSSYTY